VADGLPALDRKAAAPSRYESAFATFILAFVVAAT
jgi:hypothetical protein